MLWIPLVMSLVTGVFGLLPDFGTCPPVKTVENFDLQRVSRRTFHTSH